jgi:hypothetical protein
MSGVWERARGVGTIHAVRNPSLWNHGCTGAFGGLVLGLLSTQNPTRTGIATIAAMGAAGAALCCWEWWTAVRPGRLWVGRCARGQCPQCGYDLTGNVSGVCPECGEKRPAADLT